MNSGQMKKFKNSNNKKKKNRKKNKNFQIKKKIIKKKKIKRKKLTSNAEGKLYKINNVRKKAIFKMVFAIFIKVRQMKIIKKTIN